MTYLLDVNVLIALVDAAHLNHDAAHGWFGKGRDWATCPLTQNALVRILANPAYPTVEATPEEVMVVLRDLMAHPRHRAIDDDISVADETLFDASRIGSSRPLTDIYLLGLAHEHGMRLATFDRRILPNAVRGVTASAIEFLS